MLCIVGLRISLPAGLPVSTPVDRPEQAEQAFQSGWLTHPFSLGEQRNPFGSVDLGRESATKHPQPSWQALDLHRWMLDLVGIHYFLESEYLVCALEPPDIGYPFHSFW